MNDAEYRKYLSSCGFNADEIEQKIKDRNTMFHLHYKDKKEPRNITCASYERSQKALNKKVCEFMGVK